MNKEEFLESLKMLITYGEKPEITLEDVIFQAESLINEGGFN